MNLNELIMEPVSVNGTTYLCHCGDAHNTAERGPCPQTVTISIYPGGVRAVLTTEFERFMLAATLRRQYPNMTPSMQRLHDRLLPTEEERARGLTFVREMAAADPATRRDLAAAEIRRCDEENAFIETHSRPAHAD